MNKTPKEILLEQHHATSPKLDRLREKVLAAELHPATAARTAAVRPSSPFLNLLLLPFRQPGLVALILVAGAGFATGWGIRSNWPADTATSQPVAQNIGPHTNPDGKIAFAKSLEQILTEPGGYLRTQHIHDYVAALTAPQSRALLAQIQKNPGRNEYDDARGAVVAHLVELDPPGALALAQGQAKPSDRMEALRDIFAVWGDHDAKLLLNVINDTPNLGQRRELQQLLVNTLAGQNPAEALNYLNQLPAGQRQPYLYSQIFQQWGQNDPAAATAVAATLPAGQTRNGAVYSIASGWAQNDAQGAFAWAQTLPTGAARDTAISNILTVMGSQDPQAALKLLDTLPNNNQRTNLLYAVANSWVQMDPSAAMAWAQSLDVPPAVAQNVIPAILTQAAQNDPEAAMKYAEALSAGPTRQNAINKVASTWAQADVQTALAWVNALPDTNNNTRNNALNQVLNTWANSDPAAAAAYFQNHLDAGITPRTANAIAAQWAQSDPIAAITWVEALPDNGMTHFIKTSAISDILTTEARQNPQAALDYVQKLQLDMNDSRVNGVVQTAITTWAQEDPAKAAQIVATLTGDQQSRQASLTVADAWLNQDPTAASKWMTTLPSGPARDVAVAKLVSSQSIYEPDTAFAWALTIVDAQYRQNALRIAAAELYRANPQQAQQVIAASGLPVDQVATLLQGAQNDVNSTTRVTPNSQPKTGFDSRAWNPLLVPPPAKIPAAPKPTPPSDTAKPAIPGP